MNENTVELVGHYGGDETHACSAWTSTSRELTPDKRARIPNMLADLAKNGHLTPFEKSSLHFLVTCETASHVHALKHRIAVSINGESARYKELKEDRYYVPTDWPADMQKEYRRDMEASMDRYRYYLRELVARGLTRKRAKESARFVRCYGAQTQMDIMFNFRSFVHFCGLRASEHAQMEIRVIAREMARQVRDLSGGPFAASLAAFERLES